MRRSLWRICIHHLKRDPNIGAVGFRAPFVIEVHGGPGKVLKYRLDDRQFEAEVLWTRHERLEMC